jgi:hypothetical protein
LIVVGGCVVAVAFVAVIAVALMLIAFGCVPLFTFVVIVTFRCWCVSLLVIRCLGCYFVSGIALRCCCSLLLPRCYCVTLIVALFSFGCVDCVALPLACVTVTRCYVDLLHLLLLCVCYLRGWLYVVGDCSSLLRCVVFLLVLRWLLLTLRSLRFR